MHKTWAEFHLTQKMSAMFLVGGVVQFLAATVFAGWNADQAENYVFWGTIFLCASVISEIAWLMLFPLSEEEDQNGELEVLGQGAAAIRFGRGPRVAA